MKDIRLVMMFVCAMMMLFMIQSCSEDTCTETRTLHVWNAVYKHADTLRQEFAIERPKALSNPGKIYYYNGHIFISEPDEGIHIIDNRDPTNPKPIHFIKIPGTKDMAVKNGRLYADNYVDLLTIDISDISNPILTSRIEEVFYYHSIDEALGYLIRYDKSLEINEVDCNSPNYNQEWIGAPNNFPVIYIYDDANYYVPKNSGVGGSFARFTVAQGHLYTVDQYALRVFDLADCDKPSYLVRTEIGWDIETIFPLGTNLFIGSNSGMFIYDITDADSPAQLSQFRHARACDPVFVSDDKAYVTLRSGNDCDGFVNQLDVIDVSTLTNPKLITSHEMQNPHGLSIRGDDLFLCEGEFGLKVFDKTADNEISNRLLSHIDDLYAYDIITLSSNLAMVIGQDGLYQFDTSDPEALTEVSRITINR